MRFDGGRNATGNMEKSEDVRPREDLAENFQDFLAPPHPREPVMDECNSHARVLPRTPLRRGEVCGALSLPMKTAGTE